MSGTDSTYVYLRTIVCNPWVKECSGASFESHNLGAIYFKACEITRKVYK